MSDDGDDIPPERDDRLFSGLSFFLTSLCPTRDYFRKLLETNGGKICKTDRSADLIISDHLKSQGNVQKAVSYKWIVACVENGELVDTENFFISALQSKSQLTSKKAAKKSASSIKTQIAAIEPLGGFRPTGGRVPFTQQDDNILLWWIEKEAKLSGNKSYQELASWCTRHGWQGWRERWVKKLSKEKKYARGPRPDPDFDITKVPGWKRGINRPGDGASTSLGRHDDETDSEGEMDMRPEHVAAITENLPGLLKARSQDEIEDIFVRIADRFPERSIDEFKEFYYKELLPRFEEGDETQSEGEEAGPEETTAAEEEELEEEVEEELGVEEVETPRLVIGRFSIREQRSLFAQFDDIVWADSKEEQLQVCQSVADEFGLHSAEQLLQFALTKMKPVIKRLKGKGKVEFRDLEQAVLKSLVDFESPSKAPALGKASIRSPIKKDQSPKKQEVRFEKLETPVRVQRGVRSQFRRRSTSSSDKLIFSTPKVPSPIKQTKKAAQTPPSGQVLVYSPEIPTQLPPESSPIEPSSFHTPATSKTNKVVTGSSVSVRRAPPSIPGSPGTPTPRPRVLVKSLSLLEDDPIPSESSPNPDPLKKFTESIQEHLNSSEGPRKVPPSSPPGMVPSSVLHNLPRQSPPKQPAGPYSSFYSSNFDESEEMPYKKPLRAAVSSVQKHVKPPSSQPSTVKRRKTGSSNHQELVVESTPERKLFPLPVLDPASSSIGPSSPIDPHRQQRGYSQTLSPLAYKSSVRKRKAEERYREITPPLVSQEIEVEDRRSDTQDTIEEEHEEEATVIDADFVMIKEEDVEPYYERHIRNEVNETSDADRTEEEFDGDETQDEEQSPRDDDTEEEEVEIEVSHAEMQVDDYETEEEEGDGEDLEQGVDEEYVSENDRWEEEADPMEMDSLTNRNLGILNDNSPVIAGRQSVTPVIPEDSDDISNRSRTQTASESPGPMSQLSVRAADSLVDGITARFSKQYNLEEGAVGLVIYATSCNEDLMHIVLQQLAEYQEEYGTLAGFKWPVMRGIWTIEDDKAVNNEAPAEDIERAFNKHGEKLMLARWDWLAGIGETQMSNLRSVADTEGSVTPGRRSPAYDGLLAPSRENSVAPEDFETPHDLGLERSDESLDVDATPTPRPKRR
ncbi:hypothetical protein TWF225_004141 [Orbilia oligospora]|nr:hypothetical protein TWF225_004141 [Orbilia oligospora]KAF3260261.1 hypothetical protein TWF217_004844 [Orbilia oligospora]KAF3267172.1 hypothetical protein TWF128_010117 [Orbilia oligospora]KAF3285630.1 hypothetical protein TWF132_009489 [Orbilia oligospora]